MVNEQEQHEFCIILDTWYQECKGQFQGPHPLGMRKEDLKSLVCQWIESKKFEKEDINWKLKVQAQMDYCEKKKVPFFAPQDSDSWCCGRNIWERISFFKASTELITGCPFCCRSFCD